MGERIPHWRGWYRTEGNERRVWQSMRPGRTQSFKRSTMFAPAGAHNSERAQSQRGARECTLEPRQKTLHGETGSPHESLICSCLGVGTVAALAAIAQVSHLSAQRAFPRIVAESGQNLVLPEPFARQAAQGGFGTGRASHSGGVFARRLRVLLRVLRRFHRQSCPDRNFGNQAHSHTFKRREFPGEDLIVTRW